jgi:hypothetical protein
MGEIMNIENELNRSRLSRYDLLDKESEGYSEEYESDTETISKKSLLSDEEELGGIGSSLMFYRIKKWRALEKKKNRKHFPKESYF